MDYFYDNGLDKNSKKALPAADLSVLNTWFNRYLAFDAEEATEAATENAESDKIKTNGLLKFCEDLSLDPEDKVLLVISHSMNAVNMLEYTRAEFCIGMQMLEVDSVETLKQKLSSLRGSIEDLRSSQFKEVYMFAFDYARSPKTQRALNIETALALWELLFFSTQNEASEPKALWVGGKLWFEFLRTEKASRRGISKDEWKQLYVFLQEFKLESGKVVDYDENGAWPTLLDDFVDYLNLKK